MKTAIQRLYCNQHDYIYHNNFMRTDITRLPV
jgi:hypothetical protein